MKAGPITLKLQRMQGRGEPRMHKLHRRGHFCEQRVLYRAVIRSPETLIIAPKTAKTVSVRNRMREPLCNM